MEHRLLQVRSLAHYLMRTFAQPNDLLVDATVGNGHDTQVLLDIAMDVQGHVLGFDIQEQALVRTRQKNPSSLLTLVHANHAELEKNLLGRSIGVLVYNLGYLPHGNKNLTTLTESTLASLQQGLRALRLYGGIIITCYPGHTEGKRELQEIDHFLKSLNAQQFTITKTSWQNRQDCPIVFSIQKIRS